MINKQTCVIISLNLTGYAYICGGRYKFEWRSAVSLRNVMIILVLLASTSPSLAHPHRPHHWHRAYAGAASDSSGPARMIEVRPGLWVGSYQCITDLDRGGRDCSSGI
jgi:hypothetical protein